MSALFKYEPDEDDERKTYSTPDGAANHAAQVVTRVADFWALVDIRIIGNWKKFDFVSQHPRMEAYAMYNAPVLLYPGNVIFPGKGESEALILANLEERVMLLILTVIYEL